MTNLESALKHMAAVGYLHTPLEDTTLELVLAAPLETALSSLIDSHVFQRNIPDLLAALGMSQEGIVSVCRRTLGAAAAASPPGVRWALAALKRLSEGDNCSALETVTRHRDFWWSLGLYSNVYSAAHTGNLGDLAHLAYLVCGNRLWEAVADCLEGR